MSKFIPAMSLETSPVTQKGELITSRLGNVVDSEGNIITGSWQIDKEEVVSLLAWLDEKAPLMYSTKSLLKSYDDMRAALHDLLGALGEVK